MQPLPFSKAKSFLDFDAGENLFQSSLDDLQIKKISWNIFLGMNPNLSPASQVVTRKYGRTLLHLAVLENKLEVISLLKNNPVLKVRRDSFGLSAIDIAFLLKREEALQILKEFWPIQTEPFPEKVMPLAYPVFESKQAFEQVLKIASKAKRKDKIPTEKIWMGIYFDKDLKRGRVPPIQIRYITQEKRYGVFAEKKMAPCVFVGEYAGIIEQKKIEPLEDKKHYLRYTVWEGSKHFVINAEKEGNFTRFLHSSNKPNLGLEAIYWRGIPRMIFLSLKEILEGEELTFCLDLNLEKKV